ncbi:MAG: nitroreductase family protein [Methanobacteriota archaeon]|nr:MAG: nitroreductase family protein [Euryarchaeota archaeon]
MEVVEAIKRRRALRTLDSRPLESGTEVALIEAARLSASCFNNQPWNFIFCSNEDSLAKVKEALPRGNAWATRAPLIIVVASKAENDCQLSDRRDYHLFDCGLAVGQMLLRATELGFIAHPIAGFDPSKVRNALGVPDGHIIIALVICGYRGQDDTLLSDKQKASEAERPERKKTGENFNRDWWGTPFE